MPCFGGKLLSIFNKQSISTLDIDILFDINSGWTNKSWNNGFTSSSYREHRSFFTMLRLSTQWCFCRQYSADSTFRVFLWCHLNLSNHMTWGKWRSIANCKRPIKNIGWLSRMFSDNSEKCNRPFAHNIEARILLSAYFTVWYNLYNIGHYFFTSYVFMEIVT